MNIFGWIILSILATFGLGIAVLLVIPFLLSLFKTISYKVKKQIENAKIDIDARASQKKIRQEKLRTAQNELANKKLQNKLNKIAKQIELEEQKLALDKELENNKQEEEEEVVKEEIINDADVKLAESIDNEKPSEIERKEQE